MKERRSASSKTKRTPLRAKSLLPSLTSRPLPLSPIPHSPLTILHAPLPTHQAQNIQFDYRASPSSATTFSSSSLAISSNGGRTSQRGRRCSRANKAFNVGGKGG